MAKPLLLSIGQGKVQELNGGTQNYVPVWNATTSEWEAAPVPGGGGGGGVTSVGLTGGTSGLVIGGATSPITSAGTYTLDAPLKFAFNTSTPLAPTSPGEVSWNATEGSLNTLMVGGNVDAVIGQQLYQRAVNDDTVTLTKGMVVYVFGSSGTRVKVKRAIANADLTSATILGVVAETIAVNAEGFIITSGLLKDLSVLPATSFADGDVVYLSPTTAGGLTTTKPVAPQHLVMVGYCVKASNGAAGVLMVHPQNGYELGELHDVYISSPTSGQILIYDATSGQTRWENATPTGSAGVVVTPGAGSLAFSLDPTYAPVFLGLALSGLSASQFVKTNASKELVSQQYVSLTTEVSGTLPVGNGGTGKTSVTSGRLLLGAGASALTELAGTTSGDVVKWNGSAWTAGSVPAVTSVSTVDTGMGLTLTTANGTTTPVITLGGTLSAAKGGTGRDMSGDSGVVVVSGGTFSARTLTNGDVSNSAAIARSKLATGTAYRVLANDASGGMTDLGTGAAGTVLTSNGPSALPTFQSIPYDLAGEAVGAVSLGQTVFHFIAPRAFTMTALSQGTTASAVVKIQKNGADVTLPGSVSVAATDVITAVVTTAGTDVWFTVTGNV